MRLATTNRNSGVRSIRETPMSRMSRAIPIVATIGASLLSIEQVDSQTIAPFRARDPGVRGGPAAAGGPLAGLTAKELAYFNAGRDDFEEVESVARGPGPTMKL